MQNHFASIYRYSLVHLFHTQVTRLNFIFLTIKNIKFSIWIDEFQIRLHGFQIIIRRSCNRRHSGIANRAFFDTRNIAWNSHNHWRHTVLIHRNFQTIFFGNQIYISLIISRFGQIFWTSNGILKGWVIHRVIHIFLQNNYIRTLDGFEFILCKCKIR